MLIEGVNRGLRGCELEVCSVGFVEILVELHQVHVELDGIERTLNGLRGNVRQGSLVFADRIGVLFLNACDLSAEGVQAVVVGFNSSGTPEERVCAVNGTDGDLGLRRGELEVQILRFGIGHLNVKPGGLFFVASQLIGVGELGFHIGALRLNRFQGCNGFVIMAGFAIVAGHRALHFRVVGRARFGHLQVAAGEVEIVHVLVGHGQQQLCASASLEAFCLTQRGDSILIIAGADLQIAEQHGVVGLFWIDGEHFLQKVLRLLGAPHHGVGLREAGEAEDRGGLEA